MSDLLSVREVVARLGIERHAVLSLIKSGVLKGIDVSSNPGTGRARWRVEESELVSFIARRTHKPVKRRRRQRRNSQSVHEYF